MRFLYCGYDFFHECLAALVENGHEMVELYSWPTDNEYDFNTNVFDIARRDKTKITLSPITIEDIDRVSKLGVDMIISAAYPFKIPRLNQMIKYGVNIHPAELPVGRGPWPLPWVILKKLSQTGVTIHEISDKMDSGDILMQEVFDVSERETLESLSLRSQLLAKEMIIKFVNNVSEYWEKKKTQGQGDYWPMPKREDRTIKWEMSVEEIDRIARAFSKFEAFVFINGIRHFIRRIDFWKERHSLKPGTVALRSNREVVYAASNGYVSLSSYVRADEG